MLDRRIRLERRGTGTDPLGQPLEGWSIIVAVMARRLKAKGEQAVVADRDTEVREVSFRVRSRPFATSYQPGDRLVELARRDHCQKVWNIHSIFEVEGTGGEFSDVLCGTST